MSNNLIFQCRLGNNPDYAKHCVKNIRSYAEKIGVKHMFTQKVTIPGLDSSIFFHRYFNILEPIYNPYFDQFDKILYMDTDVIADPDAENIFDIELASHIDVMGVYEKPLGNSAPGFMSKDRHIFESKHIRFNIPQRPGHIKQLNTGVILFTKKGRLKARKLFDDWIPWVNDIEGSPSVNNDQPFLNAMFVKHKFNIFEIDDVWNMPPSWFIQTPCPKANFYHFSGGSLDPLITSFEGDNMPAGKKFRLNIKKST